MKMNKSLLWIKNKSIAILWLIGCISLTMQKILMKVQLSLDSDMSSELLLGKLLADNGNFIFSKNWFYSADLRVLDMQIIYGLLFRITDDYRTVRIIGAVAAYSILLISLYYLLSQLELRSCFPWIGGCLFFPYSESWVWVVVKGVFYIPFIALSFTVVGMFIHILQTDKTIKKNLLIVGIMALSVFAGMAGLRHLLILYIPLLMTMLLINMYQCINIMGGGG